MIERGGIAGLLALRCSAFHALFIIGRIADYQIKTHGLTRYPLLRIFCMNTHAMQPRRLRDVLLRLLRGVDLPLPRGLTTVICDPHEIVNVMGETGFAWFVRCAEQAMQNQYLQVSSCVPALAGCDVNGADFPLEKMVKWRDHPLVTGLAEMMDYPGVVAGQDVQLNKIDAFRRLTIDGHCPGLGGKALNAYIAAGVENCHESYLLEEGRRKLELGMALMMREGSAARNLNALAPLLAGADAWIAGTGRCPGRAWLNSLS